MTYSKHGIEVHGRSTVPLSTWKQVRLGFVDRYASFNIIHEIDDRVEVIKRGAGSFLPFTMSF